MKEGFRTGAICLYRTVEKVLSQYNAAIMQLHQFIFYYFRASHNPVRDRRESVFNHLWKGCLLGKTTAYITYQGQLSHLSWHWVLLPSLYIDSTWNVLRLECCPLVYSVLAFKAQGKSHSFYAAFSCCSYSQPSPGILNTSSSSHIPTGHEPHCSWKSQMSVHFLTKKIVNYLREESVYLYSSESNPVPSTLRSVGVQWLFSK